MGVFRSVERPTYDAMMAGQLERAAEQAPGDAAALQSLLAGADTWKVG
jgi:2-oxoglutarate ferredoxin oxidoreductase subunit beta